MKQILECVKKYKKIIFFAVMFMGLDVVSVMLEPYLMSKIIENGIEGKNTPYIVITGILMILVAIMGAFSGIMNARFSARAGVSFAADLREKIFSKVQEFSFENIDKFSTESLVTRMTNDVHQMQHTVTMGMRIVVRAPLMFIFAICMALTLNAKISLIFAFIIPILSTALLLIIFKSTPLFSKMQKAIDRLNGTIRENLMNVRVVKSFVRQEDEKEKFKSANRHLNETSLKAMYLVILNMPVMSLLMNITTVLVVWFSGNQIINFKMTVAELSAYLNYINHILFSLMMFSMMFINITRASASFKRVAEIFDTKSTLQNPKNPYKNVKLNGNVEFKNVSFKYFLNQKEYVLKDISFFVKKGDVVAIVGGTGSGKTSLVQLIPRLYDVTKGEILIDGINVKDYEIESLRNNIGVVLQKNTLFSGTISDNLKWGNPEATKEDIEFFAKTAQAHEFIMSFPDGYNTFVEQGGVNLSGGQKQRLCIARAMLKKPAILILDDSTSAVDTATERNIREAFGTVLKDTTTFIIAQRISSVKDADKIIVLSDGTIEAIGTHDELIEKNETYREIYISQQGRGE
ncbi:MAG: ABC transporter ATP-binding protein [Ruminococcaceae bacterium]|nr:ABC transporter ATP-binding protein [Oscillospiraceae bacterium]